MDGVARFVRTRPRSPAGPPVLPARPLDPDRRGRLEGPTASGRRWRSRTDHLWSRRPAASAAPTRSDSPPRRRIILVELGWDAPAPPSSPNWRRVEATTSPDIAGVAAQAMQTFRLAFELTDKDQVLLTMFPSPRRGETPASECLPGDDASLEDAAPRKGFRPTTEAWADYYRQLFPGHTDPQNSFETWMYATSAKTTAEGFWDARQRELSAWESEHGNDHQGWSRSHPPVVLQHEGIAKAACLGCTWIAGGEDEDELRAAARRHSLDHGDPEVVIEGQPAHCGSSGMRVSPES